MAREIGLGAEVETFRGNNKFEKEKKPMSVVSMKQLLEAGVQ